MGLKRKAAQKIRSFDLPVSYRINEARPRLRDALNVMSNQGRIETRNGRSKYNSTALSGAVLSMSFFKNAAETKYLSAKVGASIYSVSASGAHTEIKSGLSSSSVHRAINWSRGASSRQIIACGSDGLFQWNGTSFTQLGQAVPVAPSATSAAGTGTLAGFNYTVYLTYYSSSTGFETNASQGVAVKISSSLVVQDLTYRARLSGAEGNLISITYTAGATAGAEVVTVSNNAITVQIAAATTTANQIKTLIERSAAASVLVDVELSGTGTAAQAAAAVASLSNGRSVIALTSIPATAANSTIDTVRIYAKETSSADDATYISEVSLGTTTYNITADSTSSQTPPLSNGAVVSGGGKYLLEFNRKLAILGNSSYPNDVIFSEEDLPDAFNDGTASGFTRLYVPGDGIITGGAVGLYNNSVLDPFMVIFKRRSTHIYSEIGGEGKFVTISSKIGCVSHDSIINKNGVIYFLSDTGWRVIENGRLVTDDNGNAMTLGMGDIDDIFKQPGYVYGLNKSALSGAFSVYYAALDQYISFVPEGSSSEFSKAYSYEFNTGGFKPYQFFGSVSCACIGEDSSGDEVVFMADSAGVIYTHSIKEARADDDTTGTDNAIQAFAMLTWMDGDDMDSSLNFRELLLRRVAGTGDITVKTWLNYTIDDIQEIAYDFANPDSGFILDESALDEGTFGDDRTVVTARADINRTGENILIGFYQNEIGSNINLISAQLEWSRNGNRNR